MNTWAAELHKWRLGKAAPRGCKLVNNILCLHRLGLQLGERVHYRQYPHQPCLGPGRWAEADQLSQLLRKGKTSHLQGHALDIRQARFMVAVLPHVVDTIVRVPLCYAPRDKRGQCPHLSSSPGESSVCTADAGKGGAQYRGNMTWRLGVMLSGD